MRVKVDSHGWASRIYSSVVQAVSSATAFNLAIQVHWNWVDPTGASGKRRKFELTTVAINDMEVARETFHYEQ
jgi:hypothetical protein